MAKPKRKAPHDPAAQARQALERLEREREIARLQRQGAIVTLDPGRRILSARLSNVFNLLLQRKTITQNHHDAAYRLAQSWAAWKGLDGKAEVSVGYVDGGSACREIVTDRMIHAGREVADRLEPIAQPHRRLVEAFMVATVEEDRPMVWRGIVERVTGETVRDRQTGTVVEALELLRRVYEGAYPQDAAPRRTMTA